MKHVVLLACLLLSIVVVFFLSTSKNNTAAQKELPREQTRVDNSVGSTPLREKITSLMILHTPGADADLLKAFIEKYRPAGIILMSDNIPRDINTLSGITASLQKDSSYPIFISIDQEGCSVARIKESNILCASDLKNLDYNSTKEAFTDRSKMLQGLGVNLNFGIVADITADKDSFIYPRVFGSNPQTVAGHVAAAVDGTKPYTLSTLKHFPGHGRTADDTHTTIAHVDIDKNTWLQSDYIPFKKGIEAQAEMVMYGHLIYDTVDKQPVSLSRTWHDILRKEENFQGIIITDDMIMLQKTEDPEYKDVGRNAIRALKAGNDILLFVNEYNLEKEPVRRIDVDKLIDSIEEAVKKGEIDEEQINESVDRVLRLRKTL